MHIIDFQETKNAYSRYDEAVSAAKALALEVQEHLVTSAIAIATAGLWREWDATIPEGTVMHFDPDDLASCGDPVVAQLVLAADALDAIV